MNEKDKAYIELLEETLDKDPKNLPVRKKLLKVLKSNTLHGLMNSASYMLKMIDDNERNLFYEEIIKKNVKDKSVLEIGTGVGLLSCLLDKYGVKNATACEANPRMFDLASKNLELNKCKNISILNNISYDLDESHFHKYDYILQELYASDGLGENILEIIKYAKIFLKENGRVIPGVLKLWVQPVCSKKYFDTKGTSDFSGLKIDLNDFLNNTTIKVEDKDLFEINSEAINIFTIDLNSDYKLKGEYCLPKEKLKGGDGFVAYFTVEESGEVLSSFPVDGVYNANHWNARFLKLTESCKNIWFKYNRGQYLIEFQDE